MKLGSAVITVTTFNGHKTATCTVTVVANSIAVSGVELNAKEATIIEGETEQFIATIMPADATNQYVKWTSSDESVATVGEDGTVTGVKVGSAVITVTTVDGGKTATCTVTIEKKKVAVTGATISKDATSIKVGATEKLTVTILPADATNKNVTWESSDKSVATVGEDGTVTGVKAGSAVITVKTVDGGKTSTCNVTVDDDTAPVTGVTFNKTKTSLIVGITEQLVATVMPADATDKSVKWESSDNGVVTVDADGLITGVKIGSAVITATTVSGGKTATCNVTVKGPVIDFVAANWSTEPSYFKKLASGGSAYVDFTSSTWYTLGVRGDSAGVSILVYNQLLADSNFYVNIKLDGATSDGMTLGYMTDLNDVSSFVKVADIKYNINVKDYVIDDVNIPANGYMAIRYEPKRAWNNLSLTILRVWAND